MEVCRWQVVQTEFFAEKFSFNFLAREHFHKVKLTVVHDALKGCSAGTAMTVTVLNRPRTELSDACAVESSKIGN